MIAVIANFVRPATTMPWAILLLVLADSPPGRALVPLPDRVGVAGAFAGVGGGALLVAGGANFPDKMPWDGGTKRWTDAIYALESPTGTWKTVGRLAKPWGYGVSVTDSLGVVCIGGGDATGHRRDAFRLRYVEGRIETDRLPALPVAVANACGAIVGTHLYIVGGIESPDAKATSRDVYRLDLSEKNATWDTVERLPNRGRMLAMAASVAGELYVVGGVDFDRDGKRVYLKMADRYTPGRGWSSVADLPKPLAAAPSPLASDDTGFRIFGGDDGSSIAAKPNDHPGFSKSILRFDLRTARWADAGAVEASRVTVPCVRWHDGWVVPSGEVRPGVRSPEVWWLP
jgi:N-acetylneuraminic acid mutarotase